MKQEVGESLTNHVFSQAFGTRIRSTREIHVDKTEGANIEGNDSTTGMQKDVVGRELVVDQGTHTEASVTVLGDDLVVTGDVGAEFEGTFLDIGFLHMEDINFVCFD